ncbi:hypothetical protein KA005_06060 [bacterium]|nr:hypothetical protein [bacterium]
MKDQRKRQDTETELEEQAIKLLWDENQYEDAIHLAKLLLRRKPRYPLYYLILSDCYKGIAVRDNDLRASERSRMYWDKAWGSDGRFMRSDFWQQGSEAVWTFLEKAGESYRLRTEIHVNNCLHALHELIALFKEAGWHYRAAYRDFELREPSFDGNRLILVCEAP